MIREHFDSVVKILVKEIKRFYGDRLVSIVLFGSVARGTVRHDSDIDILIIAEKLPRGRMKRVVEFTKIEKRLENILSKLRRQGLFIELSPIIKSTRNDSKALPWEISERWQRYPRT